MALQVWLPLNGDTKNKGLSSIDSFSVSNTTCSISTNGKIGSCYELSGYGQNGIYYAGSTSLSCGEFMNKYINHHSFSLCGWFKIGTNITNRSPLISLTYGLRLGVGSSTVISLYNTSGNITCNADIATNDGKWHHVVGTYSADTNIISMYVDGVLKNTTNYNIGGTTYASSWTNGLYVGRDPNAATENPGIYFQGSINDIRIYDHCLSPKEVKEISKGLVLHYKLDDPYVEPTTNIASSLTPQANKGGWGTITATQLSANSYHLKNQAASALQYWGTFVYTLPADYANKTITFSAKVKNIK